MHDSTEPCYKSYKRSPAITSETLTGVVAYPKKFIPFHYIEWNHIRPQQTII